MKYQAINDPDFIIDVQQWNKHGDHPAVITVKAAQQKILGEQTPFSEDFDSSLCGGCEKKIIEHGAILVKNGCFPSSKLLCPGDYVVNYGDGSVGRIWRKTLEENYIKIS